MKLKTLINEIPKKITEMFELEHAADKLQHVDEVSEVEIAVTLIYNNGAAATTLKLAFEDSTGDRPPGG